MRVSRRVSETKIAEKEKKEKKVKEKEVKSEKKEPAPPLPATAAVAVKGEKQEGKSPIRHAQKGPAPKAPVPELPPKQKETLKQDQEVKSGPEGKVQPPTVEVKKEPKPAEPVDKIEADLKKVAEKLEQKTPPKYETQSSITSLGSTKEKMDELRNADGIKRDFPEELTDSDSDDENDFEQVYDIPPQPIVAAVPRIPEKQSKGKINSQIYKGDSRPHIPPRVQCNGVVSHGAQISGLWGFADYTRKSKRKTNASTIVTHSEAFYACLSSCSDSSRCR